MELFTFSIENESTPIDGMCGVSTSLTSGFDSCASLVFSPKGKQEIANKLGTMDAIRIRLTTMGHEAFWACGADNDKRIVRECTISLITPEGPTQIAIDDI